VDQKVIPILLRFLTDANDANQLEATWCLTNIAAGPHEYTRLVLSAAPHLISFLFGQHLLLQEQSAWALGNLAADCEDFRDLLRANGAILPLINLLRSKYRSIIHTAAWALSNMVMDQNKKVGPFVSAGIFPLIIQHIQSTDNEIVTECCWILSRLISSTKESSESIDNISNMKTLIQSGLLIYLANLLHRGEEILLIPTLRILQSFVNSFSEEICGQLIATDGILSGLHRILLSSKRVLIKECVYLLSNLCSFQQPYFVQSILNTPNMSRSLIELFQSDDLSIKKERS
jgi:importin subunit alpha-1